MQIFRGSGRGGLLASRAAEPVKVLACSRLPQRIYVDYGERTVTFFWIQLQGDG